jgi:hypothetical protein
MTWRINFAFRDRDQHLAEVLADQHALPRDERPVARAVLLELATEPGIDTAGDALDRLEAASPDERRRMLDQARAAAGLRPTGEIDRDRRWEAMQASLPLSGRPPRDEAGYTHQSCAEPGCRAFPVDPTTGAMAKTNAKRWRCEEHRAGHEQDMEPWTRTLRYGRSGQPIWDNDNEAEDEAKRVEHELERARKRREQIQAERRAEVEGFRRHAAAVRDHYRPPAGFPGGDAA